MEFDWLDAPFDLHKVTPKATGRQVTLEEVGVYTVNGDDKITREQFFFEGSR